MIQWNSFRKNSIVYSWSTHFVNRNKNQTRIFTTLNYTKNNLWCESSPCFSSTPYVHYVLFRKTLDFPHLNLRFVAYKNDPGMNIIITFSCSMTNIKVELVLYLRQMIFNHHRVSSEVNRLTLWQSSYSSGAMSMQFVSPKVVNMMFWFHALWSWSHQSACTPRRNTAIEFSLNVFIKFAESSQWLKKWFEPANSFVRDQDTTTTPARHVWETGSLSDLSDSLNLLNSLNFPSIYGNSLNVRQVFRSNESREVWLTNLWSKVSTKAGCSPWQQIQVSLSVVLVSMPLVWTTNVFRPQLKSECRCFVFL